MTTPRRSVSPALLIMTLAVAEMICAVESNMIYAAMATLYKIYGNPVRTGWLITAFLLTSAGAAAVVGRLGDLYGRSRVLIGMIIVALAGSLIALLGRGLEWVIAGRALQGTSMAILPLCYGLLRENLPQDRMSIGIGIIAGVYSFGAGIGWVFGGVVVDHGQWRDIFYYSSAVSVVALALVLRYVPSSLRLPKVRLDILGGLLFLPAVTLVLLGITLAKNLGWLDREILALIGGGGLLMAAWVRHELNHEHPLIDVRLLGNRQIGLCNLTFLLFGFGPLAYSVVFFPLLQQPTWTGVGLGLSATATSLLQIPGIMVAIVGGIVSGRLAVRYTARHPLLLGCTLQAGGFVLLALHHGSLWTVLPLLYMITGGMNMVYTSVPMLILQSAPTDRSSEATGLVQVVRSTGMAVGSQIAAFFLTSAQVRNAATGATYPAPPAYTLAFAEMAVFGVILILLALALPRSRSPDRTGVSLRAGSSPMGVSR
jgi:MFS family permease